MVSAQGYIFRIFYRIRQQLFYTANLNQYRLKYANIPICDKHENRIYIVLPQHTFFFAILSVDLDIGAIFIVHTCNPQQKMKSHDKQVHQRVP